MTYSNHKPLKVLFEPQTLTQLGILDTTLTAVVEYQYTEFQKTGMQAFLRRLPIFKSMTPFKPAILAMDVDLSCVLLNQSKNVVDKVWYGKLRSINESVRHYGDALVGTKTPEERLATQEKIVIRLHDLPDDIHHLLFFVSSYHKHPLTRAKKGVAKIMGSDNQLIHACNFDTIGVGERSLLMWHLRRDEGDFWVAAPQTGLDKNFALELPDEDLTSAIHALLS